MTSGGSDDFCTAALALVGSVAIQAVRIFFTCVWRVPGSVIDSAHWSAPSGSLPATLPLNATTAESREVPFGNCVSQDEAWDRIGRRPFIRDGRVGLRLLLALGEIGSPLRDRARVAVGPFVRNGRQPRIPGRAVRHRGQIFSGGGRIAVGPAGSHIRNRRVLSGCVGKVARPVEGFGGIVPAPSRWRQNSRDWPGRDWRTTLSRRRRRPRPGHSGAQGPATPAMTWFFKLSSEILPSIAMPEAGSC